MMLLSMKSVIVAVWLGLSVLGILALAVSARGSQRSEELELAKVKSEIGNQKSEIGNLMEDWTDPLFGRPLPRFEDPVRIDLDAVRWIESGGDEFAVSRTGARGPYQISRKAWLDAACWLRRTRGVNVGGYDEGAHRETLAREVAKAYLNDVIPAYLAARSLYAGDRTGPVPDSVDARLAAYNAGARRVREAYADDPINWQRRLPKETREYLSRYHAQIRKTAAVKFKI